MTTSIRFKNQGLSSLRGELLKDLSVEHFAVLLAKQQIVGNLRVLTVMDVVYPKQSDYVRQEGAALKVSFDTFMRGVLRDVDERVDVDTVIDVHTHPFADADAWFSSIDDMDESSFAKYLDGYDIYYASIVFTQRNYKARYWCVDGGSVWHEPADIKTQKPSELLFLAEKDEVTVDDMFNRGLLALGLNNMRKIAGSGFVTIVGIGGLGSIVAEHLIHMGFSHIRLVDFDRLELTNMNRIVGATKADAEQGRLKVDAVKDHLLGINPDATVETFANNVFDSEVEKAIAESDWIMVATDNHASRFHVQELCFKYFVPFITAGVNITVEDEQVHDVSGEVILVRMGDRVCLSCLGRVNFNQVAHEIHPDPAVREGLVRKGYVQGKDVHEPAVKTLNTHLATMAVDVLVNQFTERHRDAAVLVYEDNNLPTIYEDVESVAHRNKHCATCEM